MGLKIDKTQLLGAIAIASVALSYSAYTGKLDISKLTGKNQPDMETMFGHKLPPPVVGADPLIPTESQAASDVSHEDVLARIASETSETDAFVAETAGVEPAVDTSAASQDTDPLAAITAAAQPHAVSVAVDIAPSAQLASTDPAKLINAGAVAFTKVTPATQSAPVDTVIGTPAASATMALVAHGPRVFGAPGSTSTMRAAPAQPTHATLPDPRLAPPLPAPLLPPAPNGLMATSGRAPSVPSSASMPVLPAPLPGPAGANGRAPVAPSDAGDTASYGGNSAAAAAAIASLPSNATGKDLLELQTQLAVLDKQKAIAAGHEAIAESRLKAAKAAYEMSQIGQPSAEERAAMAAARAAQVSQVQIIAAPAPVSVLDSAKLLSTTRANGGLGATLKINGKLVDVKKGSVVGGLLVDKVTENSVTLIGDGKTQTVWLD